MRCQFTFITLKMTSLFISDTCSEHVFVEPMVSAIERFPCISFVQGRNGYFAHTLIRSGTPPPPSTHLFGHYIQCFVFYTHAQQQNLKPKYFGSTEKLQQKQRSLATRLSLVETYAVRFHLKSTCNDIFPGEVPNQQLNI